MVAAPIDGDTRGAPWLRSDEHRIVIVISADGVSRRIGDRVTTDATFLL